jgi:hypothetical protein
MRGKTTSPSKSKIASEIRVELRSILRQLDDLRKPIRKFDKLPHSRPGQPSYYVHFGGHSHRIINGGRRFSSLGLPDERITDAVLSLAMSVWHLKDRLHQWKKASALKEDVEGYAKTCMELLVCADLANWKKHGCSGTKSGCNPRLGVVHFDTSRSGVTGLFYNGANKTKELLVTNPVPIPFEIPVLKGNEEETLGTAAVLIAKAFEHWKPLIKRIGVLDSQDRESMALRTQMGFDVAS